MQQMSALQHQQIRTQQGMVSGGMSSGQQTLNQGMGQGQVMTQGNSPMAQMNNMNHAVLHMQQQQQQNLLQQNSQVRPIRLNKKLITRSGLVLISEIYMKACHMSKNIFNTFSIDE